MTRVGAIAVAALLAAAACGWEDDPQASEAPTLHQTRKTPRFDGPGDQLFPSVRGGQMAFVDYGADTTGGCENEADDPDCRGLLRVVSVANGNEVHRSEVGMAWPALGDGFVAWTQRASTAWRGATVHMAWLGKPDDILLTASDEYAEADVPPQVDGRKIVWVARYGYPRGIRVYDVDTREVEVIDAVYARDRGFALWNDFVAFVDYDYSVYRWRIAMHDLQTSTREWFDPLGETPGDVWEPTLADGWLAFKQGPRHGCQYAGDECRIDVVLHRLSDGIRWVYGGESASRFGPLLLTSESILWLDSRDGTYSLFGARIGSAVERRVTPEGQPLSWISPASISGTTLAWTHWDDEDFDLEVGEVR